MNDRYDPLDPLGIHRQAERLFASSQSLVRPVGTDAMLAEIVALRDRVEALEAALAEERGQVAGIMDKANAALERIAHEAGTAPNPSLIVAAIRRFKNPGFAGIPVDDPDL